MLDCCTKKYWTYSPAHHGRNNVRRGSAVLHFEPVHYSTAFRVCKYWFSRAKLSSLILTFAPGWRPGPAAPAEQTFDLDINKGWRLQQGFIIILSPRLRKCRDHSFPHGPCQIKMGPEDSCQNWQRNIFASLLCFFISKLCVMNAIPFVLMWDLTPPPPPLYN